MLAREGSWSSSVFQSTGLMWVLSIFDHLFVPLSLWRMFHACCVTSCSVLFTSNYWGWEMFWTTSGVRYLVDLRDPFGCVSVQSIMFQVNFLVQVNRLTTWRSYFLWDWGLWAVWILFRGGSVVKSICSSCFLSLRFFCGLRLWSWGKPSRMFGMAVVFPGTHPETLMISRGHLSYTVPCVPWARVPLSFGSDERFVCGTLCCGSREGVH